MSHVLYAASGVLDDTVPAERTLGLPAGLAWARAAELTAVYTDRGVSRGLQFGIDRAREEGRPVEMRSLFVGGHGSPADAQSARERIFR